MKRKTRLFIFISVLLLLFSGCDIGVGVVKIKIIEYPTKTIYYKGVDDKLNLDGLILEATHKNNSKMTESYNTNEEHFLRYYTIKESIDFNETGEYEVTIEHLPASTSFKIKVVE